MLIMASSDEVVEILHDMGEDMSRSGHVLVHAPWRSAGIYQAGEEHRLQWTIIHVSQRLSLIKPLRISGIRFIIALT